MMTAKQVAQYLGISTSEVYYKVKRGSLRADTEQWPMQFRNRDVYRYRRTPPMGREPVVRNAMIAYIDRAGKEPVKMADLVAFVESSGASQALNPYISCARAIVKPPFKRVRRGWYTLGG